MPNFKELVVVLGISTIAFWWLRSITSQFCPESDFVRRRNIWFALTVTGFVCTNMWFYMVVAVPLMVWGGRKDSNPVALYLVLLHVIPPTVVPLPFLGIDSLFDIGNYRILALCILVPTAWRLRSNKSAQETGGWQAMDLLLLAFGVLQTLLFVRPDSPTAFLLHDSVTNGMRRGFLFLLDIYALYYVVSRSCTSKAKIVDAMAVFCVVSCIMALEATFETVRHWLLYQPISLRFTPYDRGVLMAYLMRNGALRAQASAGHSLALGYLLAVAFGFWLYLQAHVESKLKTVTVGVVLWAGLIACYSRGPWIGGVVIYLTYVLLNPKVLGRMARAVVGAVFLCGVIALTPLGDRISAVLPFMSGSVDSGNLDYRRRLAVASWKLIRNHPILGDQNFISKMQDLRQGQGIIDIVNTYAGTALEYGLVGLSLFVGFMLVGIIKAYRFTRANRNQDADLFRLGISILACISGTMLMIYNCSFIFGYEKMFYVLAGLTTAYAGLAGARRELAIDRHSTPRPVAIDAPHPV